MPGRVPVTVVVPVREDQAGVDAVLGALERQTLGDDEFEVIIVDDGSPRPIVIDREYRVPVTLLRQTPSGSYAARNRGARRAAGEILAFTDAGCFPEPGWLERGTELARSTGGPVAGIIEVPRPADRRPTIAETYDSRFGLRQDSSVEGPGFGATANLVVPRAVFFDEVGPFDDRLTSGGDLEWGRRARHAGRPVVFSDEARVVHPPRATLRDVWRQHRRYRRGHIVIARLHPDPGTGDGSISFLGWLRWAVELHLTPMLDVIRAAARREIRGGRVITACLVGGAVVSGAWITETLRHRLDRGRPGPGR